MKFLELILFGKFVITSSVKAERGSEIIYVKVPPCVPSTHYEEDVRIVMREVSKVKNQNYLNHQLSRLANAISEDGKSFVHINDDTEIKEVINNE
jgi:hypothetical protein